MAHLLCLFFWKTATCFMVRHSKSESWADLSPFMEAEKLINPVLKCFGNYLRVNCVVHFSSSFLTADRCKTKFIGFKLLAILVIDFNVNVIMLHPDCDIGVLKCLLHHWHMTTCASPDAGEEKLHNGANIRERNDLIHLSWSQSNTAISTLDFHCVEIEQNMMIIMELELVFLKIAFKGSLEMCRTWKNLTLMSSFTTNAYYIVVDFYDLYIINSCRRCLFHAQYEWSIF